ncbi:MAG: SDR family oxidoreductase [Spirochaetota bacterium]|nr:SDR family oxidoreductase [Spirochaetota bacterium]
MEKKLSLKGKNCLITGGSRGLGRALCVDFAKSGANIAFTYSKHDEDAGECREILAQYSEPLVFKGSVADGDHVKDTVKSLMDSWGKIDVLVNNAAINQMLPLALLEENDWDDLMDINLKGCYLYSRAVIRFMIRQKKGHILNVGSFSSERFIESPIHYAGSKSGLRGLTESLALEVGKHNILVNLIAPGILTEGMSTIVPHHRVKEYEEQSAMGRLASTEEITPMARFLVSDKNTFMTGAKIVCDGGL